MNLLPEVSSLVDQLTHWLPRAKAVCDDGDGLRSPSLEGSVSGGGWSDSVQERHVLALDRKHVDEETGDVWDAQTAAARLARAEDDIAAARRALTCAWADAHRRVTVANPHSLTPLRLPSDHLEACKVLCSALSDLGPVDDGDGLVADRIRDAHRHLERALGAVHGVLPAPNAVKRLEPSGDPGCVSCARIKGHDGRTPFYSDTRTPGSKLCGACENVTRQRKDQWRAEHPPRCTHCHATVGTDEAAEACPGGSRKEQLKGFAARLASALGADEERPHRWRDQPIPTDQRPFWPPIGFLEHLRDRGHTRATPAQWAGWHAAERAAEAKKRKRSA